MMAKESDDKLIWMNIAEDSISKLKEMSDINPKNYINKFHLLKAEIAAALADESNALQHFRKSISLSNENCFKHEEALACERAGIFYLRLNSQQIASEFLNQ